MRHKLELQKGPVPIGREALEEDCALVDATPAASHATPSRPPEERTVIVQEHDDVEGDAPPTAPRPSDRCAPRGRGQISPILPAVAVVGLSLATRRDSFEAGRSGVTFRRAAELTAALSLFMLSSPTVILLNKHIMRDHRFHFPIVLASLGNVLMMLVTRTSAALGCVHLGPQAMGWGRYLKVVVLLNVFNFGTQVLGMSAYMFISVPEVQMMKSITVILVMVLATVFVKEPLSVMLVVSVLIITAGACISAAFESDISRIVDIRGSAHVVGVLLCASASLFEAARSVCTQILMDHLRVFDGVYWSSPAFVLMATLLASAVELRSLLRHPFTGQLVGLLALNSVLTGLIVISSFWFVKLVGALTLKVVTQARTVGLILVSVVFFHEQCSRMQYVGYSLTLVGICLFDHARGILAKRQKDLETPKAVDDPTPVNGEGH